MTIAYAWTITAARVRDIAALANVIAEVDFKVTAQEGDVTAETEARIALLPPDPEAFVPYDQVTQVLLVQWTKQACNAKSGTRETVIKGFLADRLALQQAADAPQVESKQLPWEA